MDYAEIAYQDMNKAFYMAKGYNHIPIKQNKAYKIFKTPFTSPTLDLLDFSQ